MKSPWHTSWQGPDLAVFRGDTEVDRFAAEQIERVVMVHRGAGDTPGDLAFALVELADEFIILPADTGFAGRVHFERLNFWSERQCIYWAPESKSPLPARLKRGLWLLRSSAPAYTRLPKGELASVVERWPLVGPQTWEQRKWQRIARSRPFANMGAESAPAPLAEAEAHATSRRA